MSAEKEAAAPVKDGGKSATGKVPAWFANLFNSWNSGQSHCFLLGYNVDDYVNNVADVNTFIMQVFKRHDMVFTWNLANTGAGINFRAPSEKELAVKVLGLDIAPPQNDMMQALAGGNLAQPQTLSAEEIPLPSDTPSKALTTIEKLLRATVTQGSRQTRLRSVAIINYVDLLVPAGMAGPPTVEERQTLIRLIEMGKDRQINEHESLIILTASEPFQVHAMLRAASPAIEYIPIPLPDKDSRKEFIQALQNPETNEKPLKLSEGFTVEQFANITSGLKKINIEDIHLQSIMKDQPISPKAAIERKKIIVRSQYGDLVKMPPLTMGLDDLGGHTFIKAKFRERLIPLLRRGDARSCPKGILFLGPPGCLEGNVRVHLADGRMPRIEDLARQVSDTLAPGIYPFGIEIILPTGEVARVNNLHIYANKTVRRITLVDGRQITVTKNHPLMTREGWKEAEKLNVGMDLEVVQDIPVKEEQPYRMRHVYRRSAGAKILAKLPDYPEIYTPQMGILMGILTAKGSRDSNSRLTITTHVAETELRDWVISYLETLGITQVTEVSHKENCLRLNINSTQFYDTFADFLELSKNRRVPEPIFHCPSEVIAGYLCGLFEGDGCMSNVGGDYTRRVSLKTASESLARDVQLLLARLGINSRIYVGKAEIPRSKVLKGTDVEGKYLLTSYTLSITGRHNLERFQNKVGFLTEVKNARLQEGLDSYQRNGVNNDSQWVPIASIEEGVASRVFDIEVPGPNYYIANGIVSHNTGKTVLAKALGKDAELNYLEVNPGKLKGKYVGESEANTERVLNCIQANSPTIVFIDEIDQAINQSRGSAGDSGVSQNQFGQFLEFMAEGENRGKVLWIFATNNPRGLDEAFIREGRIDWRVPILAPDTDQDRLEVLKAVCAFNNYDISEVKAKDLTVLAKRMENYTQAQIEAVCHKAFECADIKLGGKLENPPVGSEFFHQALDELRPSTSGIVRMTLDALEFTNDISYLPAKYREMWAKKEEDRKARAETGAQEPARRRGGRRDDYGDLGE
jgi:SpoVK/Ycf46/Vps4 family AAA+-type ATPase/intein/homing endonuclease